ncbi:MAG: hypothetical protein L0G94_04135 [Brachybacterium sp.]|uniref:hypothetical protein n=1 Tax=Brachybacterium sp. TaxID=1891286 RepID=UPI0026480E80|nr:hypothetical protein [Brachybacterium sp.]MDN5685859.1 hypothetical protein [Brachybacterium sp.]
MSTQAKLADLLLREAGRGGLWEWAMDERRSVSPAPWDEVAQRLAEVTDGDIKIGGAMLRRWVSDAEAKKRTY